jgi:hypothetical protein
VVVTDPTVTSACFKLIAGNLGADSIVQYEGLTGAYMGILNQNSHTQDPTELLGMGDGSFIAVLGGGQNRIERFDGISGAHLGNFAPAGSGGLSNPTGAVLGGDGFVYVASFGSDSIIRYPVTGGAGSVWLAWPLTRLAICLSARRMVRS